MKDAWIIRVGSKFLALRSDLTKDAAQAHGYHYKKDAQDRLLDWCYQADLTMAVICGNLVATPTTGPDIPLQILRRKEAK